MTISLQGRNFRIYGRVQGVGFRNFTQKRALELGVRGTVRNEPEGHVFVQAIHEASVLDAFRQSLETGPAFAKVTGIETSAFDPETLPNAVSFQVLL